MFANVEQLHHKILNRLYSKARLEYVLAVAHYGPT